MVTRDDFLEAIEPSDIFDKDAIPRRKPCIMEAIIGE
jgi:hypothetical protein